MMYSSVFPLYTLCIAAAAMSRSCDWTPLPSAFDFKGRIQEVESCSDTRLSWGEGEREREEEKKEKDRIIDFNCPLIFTPYQDNSWWHASSPTGFVVLVLRVNSRLVNWKLPAHSSPQQYRTTPPLSLLLHPSFTHEQDPRYLKSSTWGRSSIHDFWSQVWEMCPPVGGHLVSGPSPVGPGQAQPEDISWGHLQGYASWLDAPQARRQVRGPWRVDPWHRSL